MKAHRNATGTKSNQSRMMQRWKWIDTAPRSPPVKACDPSVSSAVVPPSATHQPAVRVPTQIRNS